jgi:hypothetical protein
MQVLVAIILFLILIAVSPPLILGPWLRRTHAASDNHGKASG